MIIHCTPSLPSFVLCGEVNGISWCYVTQLSAHPSLLQEYEQLAAQLDGAKTDLTKKVNDLSTAAAKEDIVVAAEEHAKNLAKIAKELEEYVQTKTNNAHPRNHNLILILCETGL